MAQTQIVLINPKSPTNVGGVMRAAGCYGVSQVWYTGERYGYARKFATDTKQRVDEIPLTALADVACLKQGNTKLVAIEMVDGAEPLPHFQHPEEAVYIFGPEDSSLKRDVLSHCDHVLYIPTHGCMNLAATVNVVLYDRLAKNANTDYSREFLLQNRDTNNRVSV
ncbi:RNA methyltransferase [Pseudoalteromonas fenneropenaei]|uniref:RNA methyltransferase n=1 Tax=Pseudoalteromonas fenneropenaei TaxID=1737459 RepID=A0ABV7CNC7_9GAMM